MALAASSSWSATPEEDVFILWDAGLYPDFAWSRNVQVSGNYRRNLNRKAGGTGATCDHRRAGEHRACARHPALRLTGASAPESS